jgi:hypothetical protein
MRSTRPGYGRLFYKYELPDDGLGGKAEKRHLKKENRQLSTVRKWEH